MATALYVAAGILRDAVAPRPADHETLGLMAEFRYVWEYTVEPDNLPRFLSAYQPDGDWAQLFRREDAYLGTELLKDRRMPYRFVTIDRWESYSAYAVFRERYKEEFDKLDAHCEKLTTSERHLGDFVIG